jgi:hypothetical protein
MPFTGAYNLVWESAERAKSQLALERKVVVAFQKLVPQLETRLDHVEAQAAHTLGPYCVSGWMAYCHDDPPFFELRRVSIVDFGVGAKCSTLLPHRYGMAGVGPSHGWSNP